MRKDRIIIAVEDPAYLASLTDKFSEELFNRAALEVISERSFFSSVFSGRQEADILIVSEELYDPAVCGQGFRRVFILTEEAAEDTQPEEGPVRICRYTGIRELYGEIIGRSAGILHPESAGEAASQILAVTSASGGTGKTTIAMALCTSFVKTGRSVLYLNCENLQTFQYYLDSRAPVGAGEVYDCLTHPGQDLYPAVSRCFRTEGFTYMPPLRAPMMTLGIRREIYRRLAREARASRDYDYVIVDTDSVFDEEKVRLLDLADKVVVVTEQTAYHAGACSDFFRNIADNNPDKYYVLCNKYDENAENALAGPQFSANFTVAEYIRKEAADEMRGQAGPAGDGALGRVVWLVG